MTKIGNAMNVISMTTPNVNGFGAADHGHTKISNAMLQDSRLSYDARGLLGDLLSRSDGHEITVSSIIKRGGVGRDKVYRMLKELSDLGYAVAEQDRNSIGQFDRQQYRITDSPTALLDSVGFDVDSACPNESPVAWGAFLLAFWCKLYQDILCSIHSKKGE
jgi:hypothetical protein